MKNNILVTMAILILVGLAVQGIFGVSFQNWRID